MGAQAVALAKAVQYDSAGTVEFVAGQDKSFFFLEMNTRLQVEHPVTELITGVDLVEQMIRSAYGEPLPFAQKDLKIDGWAMESRIYAEDPYRGFLPSIGRLVRYDPPMEGDVGPAKVRNDAGVREGDEISMFYDPMISKLSTWAKTRDEAIDVMGRALEDFHIEGLGQNIPFLAAVDGPAPVPLRQALHQLHQGRIPRGLPWPAAQRRAARPDRGGGALDAPHPAGARRPGPAATGLDRGGGSREARGAGHRQRRRRGHRERGQETSPGGRALAAGQASFRGSLDGQAFTAAVKPAAEGFVIRHRATTQHVLVLTPRSAELHERLPPKKAADTSRMVVSPMPGLVVTLDVAVGQQIRSGEAVAVIEAMKMQNIIRAERDGVVKAVNAQAGDSVAADEVLVEFA